MAVVKSSDTPAIPYAISEMKKWTYNLNLHKKEVKKGNNTIRIVLNRPKGINQRMKVKTITSTVK